MSCVFVRVCVCDPGGGQSSLSENLETLREAKLCQIKLDFNYGCEKLDRHEMWRANAR